MYKLLINMYVETRFGGYSLSRACQFSESMDASSIEADVVDRASPVLDDTSSFAVK